MLLVMFQLDMQVIKIKNKNFKFIIVIILLIFIGSYYVGNSGYYEYHMQEKTILTNNKIKEFEEDVKNNKDIDIKDYLVNEEIDYSNKLTNIVYGASNEGTIITRKIIKKIFRKLSYLVED